MIDWYWTVLNMHVVQRNDFICFMTYDDEHHRLAIVNIEGLREPDAKAWGLAHVAYTFRDIGELLSTWRRLKDQGIEPYRPIHHGPRSRCTTMIPTAIRSSCRSIATRRKRNARPISRPTPSARTRSALPSIRWNSLPPMRQACPKPS